VQFLRERFSQTMKYPALFTALCQRIFDRIPRQQVEHGANQQLRFDLSQ